MRSRLFILLRHRHNSIRSSSMRQQTMYIDSQAMRGDTTVEDARSPPICVCFFTRGGTELKSRAPESKLCGVNFDSADFMWLVHYQWIVLCS